MTQTQTRDVTVMSPGAYALSQPGQWDQRQMGVLKRTLCAEANDIEIALLGEVSRSTGADPFKGDVAMVIYNKDRPDKRKPQFIFSTAFAAKRANAAGTLAAMQGPWYLDGQGNWHEVWLKEDELPVAAKVVARRPVRNADGTVAMLEDEPTIVTYKSAFRETDFWRNDPVNMLGVAARRRALRKLDVVEILPKGVDAIVGDAGVDYRVVEGQATVIPSGIDINAPERTLEGLQNLMAASGLSNDDMNVVFTKPNEPPIHAKNFGPRVERWYRENKDLGPLDAIDAAMQAKGINTTTGEVIDGEASEVPPTNETDGGGTAAADGEAEQGAAPVSGAAPGVPERAPLPSDPKSDEGMEWWAGVNALATEAQVPTSEMAKAIGAQWTPANALAYCRAQDIDAAGLVKRARGGAK